MISSTLEKHDSILQRLLEITPGFLIWIVILSPLWAGRTIPEALLFISVILAAYWFYRGCITTFGVIVGYLTYRKAREEDWLQKCSNLREYNLPDPANLPVGQFLPKHLLLYPVGGSRYEVLKSTLDGIRAQNYPKDLIYIAISLEKRMIAKDPKYYANMKKRLKEEYNEYGDRFMIFEHPDGIPGEAVGAAANRTWGGKHAVAELEEHGEIISDFLMTTADEDHKFHPQFLAAATYQYMINEKRKQRFYQTAVFTFNNNYWEVPALIRVLAISLTLPVLASSVFERRKRETYSCFTLSLEVLKNVNYWDVSISIDDTTFYWRPYFYFNGDWECEVFFIPLSADAVYDPSYIQTHKKQYKQYVRWGWGVISFPIGMKGLLKHKHIPFLKRISKMIHLFEVFVFFKVLAYFLSVTVPIVLLLNPELKIFQYSISVPSTVSKYMGATAIFLIPATILKILLIPPKPEEMSWIRYVITLIAEIPLVLVTLLTYSFLPFVEASTRMMFGHKTVSWTGVPKTRKS